MNMSDAIIIFNSMNFRAIENILKIPCVVLRLSDSRNKVFVRTSSWDAQVYILIEAN
jgi:hypothetical protein